MDVEVTVDSLQQRNVEARVDSLQERDVETMMDSLQYMLRLWRIVCNTC